MKTSEKLRKVFFLKKSSIWCGSVNPKAQIRNKFIILAEPGRPDDVWSWFVPLIGTYSADNARHKPPKVPSMRQRNEKDLRFPKAHSLPCPNPTISVPILQTRLYLYCPETWTNVSGLILQKKNAQFFPLKIIFQHIRSCHEKVMTNGETEKSVLEKCRVNPKVLWDAYGITCDWIYLNTFVPNHRYIDEIIDISLISDFLPLIKLCPNEASES